MNETNIMDVKEQPSASNEEAFKNSKSEASHADDVSATSSEGECSACCEHADEEASESSNESHPENRIFLEGLMKELEPLPDPESKLLHVIDFMEKALAQTGSPHFKSFWQARGLCLQLFKENIAPAKRSSLWMKYTELSKEARRLKDLLDEQSAFAVEQIEIAIQALETEVSQLDQIKESEAVGELQMDSQVLKRQMSFYSKVQFELDFLNKQASRINALRKELIKTEMRVRKKNKFFQRLSLLGDKVFPRRKELITEISNHFIEDVDKFIAQYFNTEASHDSLFFLREEIKALQGTAKLLTLNTHAFTHTRMRLSECWDKIKVLEKERKKVRAQQKTVFKENMDAALQKIEECKTAIQGGQISPADGNKKLDEVLTFMRSIELGREELQHLREQIAIARQPLLEMLKTEEQKRHDQEQERQRQKRQKVVDLKHEIDQLIRSVDIHDAVKLVAERDAILEKIQSSALVKTEKLELERLLKPLRDIIADKKAMSLTTLSADDRQALQQLKDALQERRTLRQEIKDQVESLRRSSGSSGLDFEKAMEYNAQLLVQKERLEKINHGIVEIEKKISELEKSAK